MKNELSLIPAELCVPSALDQSETQSLVGDTVIIEEEAAREDCLVQEVAKRVVRCHLRLVNNCYEVVLSTLDIGLLLLEAKSKVIHGDWERMLKASLKSLGSKVSFRTCQRYKRLAELLLKIPGSPVSEYQQNPTKASRMSVLSFLMANKLTSSAKVLSLDFHSEDYITPPEIVCQALELFGTIDLDPCGLSDPQFHLPVGLTIDSATNSLSSQVEWSGRFLLHPPESNRGSFVSRAVSAVVEQEAKEGLIVIPAETDASYMDVLQPYARGFLRKRPTFATPTRSTLIVPPMPYMVVYLTRDRERIQDFAYSMGVLCDIFLPHSC